MNNAEHQLSQACNTVLPEELLARVLDHWRAFSSACAQQGLQPPLHPEFLKVLARVWACSEFVAHHCIQYPQLLLELLRGGDLLIDYEAGAHKRKLAAALAKVKNEDALVQALRETRRREMVRIAWRDLAGWAALDETLADLSSLADACLDCSLSLLHQWQSKEVGVPYSQGGNKPVSLIVLGLGKLGACELNFSSDIDLMFAYREQGETRGRRPGISNDEYFIRLGQRLIDVIDRQTEDGQVFRVDMRLRPFGSAGPLAMSFDAMEDYYQTHGREWERYALVKARVVAGDPHDGEQLMGVLRPFIYRRYLDYGAFAELRDMKEKIMLQVQRKGLVDNIKLGAGGIREVEFIAQAFQLIRGGRDPHLQERRVQRVLLYLSQQGQLPDYVASGLNQAYEFLRHTENHLQAIRDQQIHSLPQDELDRMRVALSMGFDHWASFVEALARHTKLVHSHFEQVFAAPQISKESSGESDFRGVWEESLASQQALDVLTQAGYEDAHQSLDLVRELRASFSYRALSTLGRERLDRLMPLLLAALSGHERPSVTLQRVLDFIEAVARRSAYLALLVENPLALSQLLKLCAASPWIARLLSHYPLLLDELLDPRSLYTLQDGRALARALEEQLGRVADDDLEQQMEILRHFKQANVLHIAAADIAGRFPLMVVSDHLSELAEVILAQVLRLGWSQMVAKHGLPRYRIGGKTFEAGFAVVAYGKLGGIELGYGSDLDLVFLHNSAGEQQCTSGPSSIENALFFVRLGQRIIHILNTHTASGVLYEVDMRLRPSGASGLLVSSIEAFEDYQQKQAWTWEHQALVRARVVAGEQSLSQRFATLRKRLLCQARPEDQLRQEVREMRERMRAELAGGDTKQFDLKQDAGGIADIEFLVQYGVLAWAHRHAELARWTDNIRLLEDFSRLGLMAPEDASMLMDGYRHYRAEVHRLSLQDEPAQVGADQFQAYRSGVVDIWERVMEAGA